MARGKTAGKPATKKGITPQVFKGMSKGRMEKKGGGAGKRVFFSNEDPTVTLQFLQTPDEAQEYYVHFFQEDGRWNVVPCAGKADCPLCDSDDEKIARPSYRFAINVINLKDGRVQVLEGPQALALRVFQRYKRKPALFKKRVYDVSKFPTSPVSYDVEIAEEDAVSTRGKKLIDLEQYLIDEMKAYYGDDLSISPSALDDDEDDEDDEEDDEDDELDDDEEDEDELDDDDDEEDDDDDEEDDDDEDDDDEDEDDEDEDDEPEPPKKSSKAPAKKAVAKKAPAKKTTAAKKAAPKKGRK